jgi:hypothetical protein
MPCNQQITQETLWSTGTDLTLLEAALVEAGYHTQRMGETVYFMHKNRSGAGSFAGDKLMTPEGWDAREIKREYARQSVLASAKKMGWQVKQNAKDKFKMEVRKRA